MAEFGYNLTVKCNEKEDIFLSTASGKGNEILDVAFNKKHMPSENNRGSSIHCQFTIKGSINESTREELKKMADWALDNNRDTMYRDLSIEVFSDNKEGSNAGKRFRNYGFSNMFILDYEEKFDAVFPYEEGEYVVLIGQKSEKSEQNINI